MAGYIDRIVDVEIREALETAGALVLRGARAIGKTESARQQALSELRLDSSDARGLLAREQPATALPGATPRLLDEWQFSPGIWNEVRHEVDRRQEPGQFILSGSAVPNDSEIMHSGAGRFRQVQMRTMTFAESGESSGVVSLRSLMRGDIPGVFESEVQLQQVVERIVVGGWPGWIGVSESSARARALDYVEDISTHDFVQVAGSRRDPRRFKAYLRAMSAVISHPAALTSAAQRMRDESNITVGEKAAPELHGQAERLFLVEDQPAWSPQLRSRSTAMQTPKRHLVDPSLAAALLGAGTDRLLLEPETLGFLFESQVVHDLRVYAQSCGARGVFHYRDTKGRDEIDAVVEGSDGSWIAFEMKLGLGAIDIAAANLLRVTEKMKRPPVASVVVTPTGVAHRRNDGVFVIPFTLLGP
ncbi:MAG: ATP-binding protein [Leucobacter sp.]